MHEGAVFGDDGLQGIDEAVYRAVIGRRGVTAAAISESLQRDAPDVERSLAGLVASGLVSKDPDGALAAGPPELVLGPRLARSRERLRRSEEMLAELAELYHREAAPGSAHHLVELIEGGPAQAHRLLQLEYSAQRTIRSFQSGANRVIDVPSTVADETVAVERADEPGRETEVETQVETGGESGEAIVDAPVGEAGEATSNEAGQATVDAAQDEDVLERIRTQARPEVDYRIVIDPRFLHEPAAVRALEQRIRHGWEVRIVDEPVRKLAVADDSTAMVQITENSSVLLHRPLAALAVELFEAVWQGARPYQPSESELEPIDHQLLQLMLAGLTDAALANQLGTSPRTVQRRLQALMTRAGATTRMQLGWHAFRRGWV